VDGDGDGNGGRDGDGYEDCVVAELHHGHRQYQLHITCLPCLHYKQAGVAAVVVITDAVRRSWKLYFYHPLWLLSHCPWFCSCSCSWFLVSVLVVAERSLFPHHLTLPSASVI
jgi:hypothetical protein